MNRSHRLWLFSSLLILSAICGVQKVSSEIIQTRIPSLRFYLQGILKHSGNIVQTTTLEYNGNTYLVTSSQDNTAKVWRMSDLLLLIPGATTTVFATAAVATLKHGGTVIQTTVLENAGNTYLVTGSADNTAKIWRMSDVLTDTTPSAIATLEHNHDVVHTAAFNYINDTYLVTSSDDNTAKVWRMSEVLADTTPSAIATLEHKGRVAQTTVLENAGNTYLVTSSWDNTAKVWWLNNDENLEISIQHYSNLQEFSHLLTEPELQILSQYLTDLEVQILNQTLTKPWAQALNQSLTAQCDTEKQALNQSLTTQCINALNQEPAKPPHEYNMTTLNQKLDKLIQKQTGKK